MRWANAYTRSSTFAFDSLMDIYHDEFIEKSKGATPEELGKLLKEYQELLRPLGDKYQALGEAEGEE